MQMAGTHEYIQLVLLQKLRSQNEVERCLTKYPAVDLELFPAQFHWKLYQSDRACYLAVA